MMDTYTNEQKIRMKEEELGKRVDSLDRDSLPTANIMVAGGTGVGKSTLLNAIFDADLAATGTGKPVTDHINEYQNPEIPIHIWDTVGLELDSEKTKESISSIRQTIAERADLENQFDRIHAIWYCINSGSNRYQSAELEFIKNLYSIGVPFIIVLTQCIGDESEVNAFEAQIRKINETEGMNDIDIVQVCAREFKMRGVPPIAAFGLDDLVNVTLKKLPDFIKGGFIAAQKVSEAQKRQLCEDIIYEYVQAAKEGFWDKIPLANVFSANRRIINMFTKIGAAYNTVISENSVNKIKKECNIDFENISKMMQAENYDIPGKTISFSKGMIMNMLSNERYCGDAILQKSVTVDCIEKKRKKNTGEAPMYYVQNNHPAIIDRVTFNKVQEELARRKTKTPGSAKSSITSTGKYSRYALTDVLICGNCGTRYRRVTWSRNGTKRIVWRCISRLDYGKKYCSDSPTIMEDKLQEAIVRAVNKFNKQDNATYKALMRATISEALGLNGDPEEVDMLERKVEALNNKMLALVNESVSSGDGIEAHESEFMTLSQETELLKQRIAAIQESTAKDNGEQSRLEQIQAIISERESKCMEYDDSIVRQMVECIKVYPGGKLEIIFGGGYLVEESV